MMTTPPFHLLYDPSHVGQRQITSCRDKMGSPIMIILQSNLSKHEKSLERTRRIAKRTDKNHFVSSKLTVCWCSPNAACVK